MRKGRNFWGSEEKSFGKGGSHRLDAIESCAERRQHVREKGVATA